MNTTFILCRTCKEYYNPEYHDQALKHIHEGVDIDYAVKMQPVTQQKRRVCSIGQITEILPGKEKGSLVVEIAGGQILECMGALSFEFGEVYTKLPFLVRQPQPQP